METQKLPEPLTPAVFYILLSLASGEKHGYQIMKQVKQDAHGQVKMGSGTLYGSIKRMLADDLIEEAEDRVVSVSDNERRRFYRLTDLGRRALNIELNRYNEVVDIAARRGLLSTSPVKSTL